MACCSSRLNVDINYYLKLITEMSSYVKIETRATSYKTNGPNIWKHVGLIEAAAWDIATQENAGVAKQPKVNLPTFSVNRKRRDS